MNSLINRAGSRLLTVFDWLVAAMAALAGSYLLLIMFGIVFQATARTLGYSGSSHLFTFTEYGLLFIAMFGSPWLVRQRGHVYIEILTAAVPDRSRVVLSRAIAILCVVICLVLAWYGLEATLKSYARGDADMRSIDMPRWILLSIVVWSFFLMAIQFSRFVLGSETMHTGRAGVHE